MKVLANKLACAGDNITKNNLSIRTLNGLRLGYVKINCIILIVNQPNQINLTPPEQLSRIKKQQQNQETKELRTETVREKRRSTQRLRGSVPNVPTSTAKEPSWA